MSWASHEAIRSRTYGSIRSLKALDAIRARVSPHLLASLNDLAIALAQRCVEAVLLWSIVRKNQTGIRAVILGLVL